MSANGSTLLCLLTEADLLQCFESGNGKLTYVRSLSLLTGRLAVSANGSTLLSLLTEADLLLSSVEFNRRLLSSIEQ